MNLRDYKYEPWEETVIAKYGKKALENGISDAMVGFYIGIHETFVKAEYDQSLINEEEFFIKTALDYIWQNDSELQEE